MVSVAETREPRLIGTQWTIAWSYQRMAVGNGSTLFGGWRCEVPLTVRLPLLSDDRVETLIAVMDV